MHRFVLDRYVLRLWAQPAAMFFVVVMGILLLGRVLRALEYVAEKGLSWHWLWLLSQAVMPYFLLLSMPVACFVGLVALIVNMQDASELDAARAAGISMARLLRSVYAVGALLWLGLVWVSFVWAPEGAKAASLIFHALRTQKGALAIDAQRFNEELGDWVFYADAVEQGALRGVLIEDRTKGAPVVIWAREGRLQIAAGELQMELSDGVRFEETKTGVRIVRFKRYRVRAEGIGERALRLPAQAASSWDVLWQRARRGDLRAQAELWRRIALPMELPILLLLAPSLALRAKRTPSGWVYLRAIVAVLVVSNALLASLQLAERGLAWAPPVVVALLLGAAIGLLMYRARFS